MNQKLLIKAEQEIKKKLGYDIELAVKPLHSSIVVTKTKDELDREAKRKQLEEDYERRAYEVVKKDFEKRCFKVMNPICFCEEDENGRLIIRAQDKMKQAYGNKKCMTSNVVNGVEEYFTVCFIDMWIDDEKIRTYRSMDTLPPPLECPPHIYNLWSGFAVQRSYAPCANPETAVLPFLNHLKIMVNHDENALDYMKKWLAHIFQCPAELQGTAPVFIGEQGTGKGVLCDETLSRLCGSDKYYSTANPTQECFSRFSTGLYQRVVVNIDETKAKESCANSEIMKRAITAPFYNHEEKGIKPIELKNCCRFIFTTNNQNPIKVESEDRRYFIVNTSSEKFADKEYFDGYWLAPVGASYSVAYALAAEYQAANDLD